VPEGERLRGIVQVLRRTAVNIRAPSTYSGGVRAQVLRRAQDKEADFIDEPWVLGWWGRIVQARARPPALRSPSLPY
jgi:hypothetical protein